MPLPPGAQLGPYQVLAKIGAGGMGVVYRGRDPRLNRDVAIKVLKQPQGAEGARLRERLELEARAIARISHPNILQVYDVGEHDGAPFIVMELLVGETLRERLDRGPLPVRAAIEVMLQVAAGLAAAHDQGLYHRDLKPENVFLAADDRAKILDFGLAKPAPLAGMPGSEATGALPRPGDRLTEEGAVMGTVGYLSPEQVRGAPVDARSDIFSLGVVFYEMLLGVPPFDGGSSVETMTAILRDEPPFPEASGQRMPPALEQFIRICLEKNPSGRFQTAWDLSLALQTLRAQSGSSSSGIAPLSRKGRKARPGRPWRAAAAGLAAGCLPLLLAAPFFLRRAPAAGAGAEWTPVTARSGLTATARFGPDGHSVVHATAGAAGPPMLQSQIVGQVFARPLGLAGQVMTVGRDGSVLYVQATERIHPGAAAEGMLASLLADGTEAKPILDRVEAADRSRDGRQLAVIRVDRDGGGRLNRLECPPGRTLHQSRGWLYNVRFSPGGNRLAVVESEGPDNWMSRVRVLDLQGRTLFLSAVQPIQSLAWAPDGQAFYLTRPPGYLERLDLAGQTRPLLQAPHLLHLYDVAPDGRLLVGNYQDRTEVLVRRDGQPPRPLPVAAWAARLSADGGQVLFTGPGSQGSDMTYLQRGDQEPLRPLAPGRLLGASEDGRVAYLKRKGGGLYRVPTGPGAESQVPLGDLGTVWRAVPLPDGNRLALAAAAPGKDFQLHVLDPGTDRRVTVPGSEGVRWMVPIGPDELAADGPEEGLRRCPVDGRPATPLKGSRPGDLPLRLAADGVRLFVQEAASRPGALCVAAIHLKTGARTVWRTLEVPETPGLRKAQVLAITPDGRTLATFTWAQPNDLFVVKLSPP